jgi:hypothetical protein
LETALQPIVAYALQVEELATAHVLQVEEFATACVLQARTYQLPLGTTPWPTHIHLTCPTWVKSLAENQVLWFTVHYIQVGARMAELTALQLMQSVGTRSMMRGPTNQEVGAPPPPSFPHTMLGVERMKDNMWLVFIEKLFTNRAIKTRV